VPVLHRGHGRIEEGDLNLTVAEILERDLHQLGAKVFLTRQSAEPVAAYDPQKLDEETREILTRQSYTLPPAFYERARNVPENSELQTAKEVLFAKLIEERARAAEVQRHLKPDLTIVLQHDASPESAHGRLVGVNRNIFFVDGAYQAKELRSDPHQRLRLLTKLFENVTPIETTVALFSKSPNFVQRDIGSFELSIESFDARQMFFRKCFFSPSHSLLVGTPALGRLACRLSFAQYPATLHLSFAPGQNSAAA